MTRRHDIQLEDLAGMEAEEEFDPDRLEAALGGMEDPGHPGVGTVGMCWLNGDRLCEQTCMAFDAHRQDEHEHPCLALSALRDIVDPQLEQRAELIQTTSAVTRGLGDAVRSVNNLTAALQQMAQRIR